MQRRFFVTFRIQNSVMFGDKILTEYVSATTSESAKKKIQEKYLGAFKIQAKLCNELGIFEFEIKDN